VICAIPEEIASLKGRLPFRRFRLAGLRVWHARLAGGREVFLAIGGDGARRASSAAARMLESLRPDLLVGIGAAGALTDDLAPGDLLVGRTVRDEHGEAPPPDPAWTERALGCSRATAGLLWTSERLVRTPQERRAAAAASGASGPAAADLESAAWARAAARARTPYTVMRTISDGAGERLPEILSRSQREGGGISRAGVALRALADPAAIPRLAALRRAVLDGGRRLADAAEILLALRPAGPGRTIPDRRTPR